MSSSLSGLRYQEKMIGGTFKSSKVEYTWEFILDGQPQKIELIDSRWTGKKRLIRNVGSLFIMYVSLLTIYLFVFNTWRRLRRQTK